ncbi:MAG: DUF2157 domain-containing protein [Lewinellaceae bacterium]|nr:DUF2157 domain-containing protein [Lewinellaceae bacterium]
MAEKRYLRWLQQQLPQWVEEELISDQQANALRRHYHLEEDKPDYNMALVIVGVIASLLIGGGIILIVAYKWDILTTPWRTVLSLLPLAVGLGIFGFAYLRQSESLAWRESASTFLMLMIVATLTLLSTTFGWVTSSTALVGWWLFFSIPLLYLLDSSICAILYLVGAMAWTLEAPEPEFMGFWAWILLALPHLWRHWRTQEQQLRRTALGWVFMLVFALGWLRVMDGQASFAYLVGSSAVLAFFLLLSRRFFSQGASLIGRPFWAFSLGCIFILVIAMAYGMKVGDPADASLAALWSNKLPAWGRALSWGALAGFVAGWGWQVYRLLVKDKGNYSALILLGLFPVFAWSYWILSIYGAGVLAQVIINIYGLGVGAAFLQHAIRDREMLDLNIGLLFILSIAATRFFDADWSLVAKGIAFVLLGVVFLGVNVYLSRLSRKDPQNPAIH